MSADELKTIATRFFAEFQAGGRADVADELLADDFHHENRFAGTAQDKNGVIERMKGLHASIPDVQVDIHAMAVDGDSVWVYKTIHGTHVGEFMGKPGTGKPIAWDAVDILHVRGGKISSINAVTDIQGLLPLFS